MKIALVTDWFAPRIGGIEVHVRELAIRLRERGHDAVVVTPWPGAADVSGVPVIRLPVRVTPGIGVSISPRLARHLERTFRDGGFDVVHGHMSIGSLATIAAGYASHRSGVPSIGTFHSILGPWRRAYALAAPALRWKEWQFRATAVSEVVAADLRHVLPDRPITLLPPAIDREEWRASPSASVPGRLRLVTTARLHPRKRVAALLSIVAEVRRRAASDVSLEILGEGPHAASLQAHTARLGMGDAVRFLGAGAEDDVKALMTRADAFVNACDVESFGIAGLEAICAGVPVIARREGGMTSFVEHGTNGLLLDSDQGMTEALLRLANDPRRVEALREGASRGIPDAFCWSGAVDRHLDLYEDVVARRAAPHRTGVPSR